MEDKKRYLANLENLTIFVLGLAFLLFPLAFSSLTTDPFSIPKQALLGIAALLSLLLLGFRVAVSGTLRLKRTPFDLPVILLSAALALSTIFSINRWDSLIALVPYLFGVIIFFAVSNTSEKEKHFNFLAICLLLGGAIVGALGFLSVLKVYPLPFVFAKTQSFSLIGTVLDQTLYLGLLTLFGGFLVYPYIRNKSLKGKNLIFAALTVLNGLGLVGSIVLLLTTQKPTLLPFETGFQTAFAAISQDTGRTLQGFLFGSGWGTYLTDFMRFKAATFNQNAALWNLSFLRSSSFVLELLATTGILGVLSFLFLCYKIMRLKPLTVPLLGAFVLLLLLPFSFVTFSSFLFVLSIFAVYPLLQEKNKNSFFEEEITLVSLKKGLLALSSPGEARSGKTTALPYSFFLITLAIILILGFFGGKFLISDLLFQKSLVAASQNNGAATYDLERQAIADFPGRDGYYRIFSQVNLSLANNIAASLPRGSSPSAQTQQTIYTLIQQSINTGRQATTVSPLNASDWSNLSSIYRSLIGFGQNADTFAILSAQQAVTLDPNNPQEYIALGGIYYQLQQWDNAIRQFQIAASLKPDFANAYYNLGHALESKGDLQGALTQYQNVKSLVGNNKTNLDQINKEIAAIQSKIGQAASGATQTSGTAENQPPLEVNQPQTQLPSQNPPVKIPAPKVTVTPTPTQTAKPTPNL